MIKVRKVAKTTPKQDGKVAKLSKNGWKSCKNYVK